RRSYTPSPPPSPTDALPISLRFSDGQAVNEAVRSLFISSGPSPTTLSGTYVSPNNTRLDLRVSEDGRVSGSVTARWPASNTTVRSEEHTSELQSRSELVCRL